MQAIRADILLAGIEPEKELSGEMISAVTTDSRCIQPGCVFVAFPGARFDGHDFAAQAIAQGAAYVVVNHDVPGVPAERLIYSPNSYRAMLQIGRNYRAQFAPQLVGITGSVGKTTTKEFTAAVLAAFGPTIKTAGNQNNELGLPNTLLQLTADTAYGAVEMGMSHLGEISRLSRCAQPAAGIITCIGVSHLETLGSRENILRAKLEICDGLPQGAPLALNGDDPYLRGAVLPAHVRPVWYAIDDSRAEVTACRIQQAADHTCFTIQDTAYGSFPVTIPAIGRHTVYDALAAYTAVTRLGLSAERAAAALSDFAQTGMRQHVVQASGVTVIEDCYNANPDSMRAALQMFRTYPCQRRFALLGDMLELGSISDAAHAELGTLAAHSGLAGLVTYGDCAAGIAQAARAAGLMTRHVNSHGEAAAALVEWVRPGDAVLVKASRGMALEKALDIFYQTFPKV